MAFIIGQQLIIYEYIGQFLYLFHFIFFIVQINIQTSILGSSATPISQPIKKIQITSLDSDQFNQSANNYGSQNIPDCSQLTAIKFESIRSTQPSYFFVTQQQAIEDYQKQSKYQKAEQFWTTAEEAFYQTNIYSQQYFKCDNSLIARAALFQATDDQINNFLRFLKGQKEFSLINGNYFSLFIKLWWQGLIVKAYNLDESSNVTPCSMLCVGMFSVEKEYKPLKSMSKRYKITQFPVFQCNESLKPKQCVVSMILEERK